MARPREFDESEALAKAMEAFWHKGFEDTSYDDLVKATGVSRYGLYTAFGDKQELFFKALDQYLEDMRCDIMAPLLEKGASLPAIEYYFDKMIENVIDPSKNPGCMLCNTVIELSHFNRKAKARVEEMFEGLKGKLAHALRNAKRKREIVNTESPEKLAVYLTGLVFGAAMLVRTPMARGQVANYLKTGLSTLKRPATKNV